MSKTSIEIPDYLTVRDLATLMDISPINVIKELMKSGIMANINQEIDYDTAAIVAEELGFEPSAKAPEISEEEEAALANLPKWRTIVAQEAERDLHVRPPVVTMLGHVDHGKTSLLDVIRQANIADGEAGGITQHMGAYQVEHEGRLITLLDTPGHAAFTAMRARGARATDIAILVVAADDGLMPQTREAIDHARAARVPIIVALNKIDLPGANRPKALQQLNDVGLTPDEWDGDTMVIPVSAKENLGIEDLLEAIMLTADELEPMANPKAKLTTGTIIEGKMERGRGVTATVLVQNGTLKKGDTVLVGQHYGRIKAMYNHLGKQVKMAPPGTPVSISGLNGMPSAGDQFKTVESERVARKMVAAMDFEVEEKAVRSGSLEEFFARLQGGGSKALSLIVKADVQGSLEPIVSTLEELGSGEVGIEIMRAATGRITESDVMLASASGAVILDFNAGIDPIAKAAAASEQVEVNQYKIIYKLFEDVEKALAGMLEPTYEQVVIGRAEVRQLFRIRGVGNIAGCFMRTGRAERSAIARVIRDQRLLHEGPITSLKHVAENVREVKTGFEFGVAVKDFDKFRVNDIIEFLIRQRSN